MQKNRPKKYQKREIELENQRTTILEGKLREKFKIRSEENILKFLCAENVIK